ncbi:glycoside hydrolase family 16 protein [Aquimarina intermedia]|uniref:Glycosyl hydrolase family 16 n=1 Tax=Aquimarina intermedia TaxID=350814 RepID=A0A5S5C7R6_9FLAO|nr:glycoside hydrolase family 16 protein [Aquimarina intermedia]TYP74370.1 glycosyl hydrolase family 16 [Aquimarina intermedia]
MSSIINIKYLLGTIIFLLIGCQEDDVSVGAIIAPTNIQVTADIVGSDESNPNGDGSGTVIFKANAENAIAYQFVYNGNVQSSPSGIQEYTFGNTGLSTYQVTVIAVGAGGVSSSTTVEVDVLVLYEPPIELITMLTTGSWRIKSEVQGHFGLGPVEGEEPGQFFSAPPNSKENVGMYDDRYIFGEDATFTHITNNENDDPTLNPEGTVFGRIDLIDELAGPGTGTVDGADVLNYPYSDYTGSWAISAPGGVETISLTGTSFIGYYTGGNHKYELYKYAEQPANELILRTTDGNNEFDWWFIITNKEESFQTTFNSLLWSDEFDVEGAPNSANWSYDLGTGTNGWGNGEAQTYTNDPGNVSVQGGLLRITAKAENGGYTSARIKTENLFSFTYGRVEIRARLPVGGGTWPALWMLGANFETIGWPACGEMDIMEHVGNNQNNISSALHFPENNGGNAIVKEITVPGVSTDFHAYSVDWTPEEIVFLVDNQVYHRFQNTTATPFYEKDFFLILNLAMGGNLGGAIDPAFVSSSLEVDYVRVYQ